VYLSTLYMLDCCLFFFFFQAEDGIRDRNVTGVQTCALPILFHRQHHLVDGESVGVRVHPVMLPVEHPLATVKEAYNAVFVEAESAGRLMFYGAGAGGVPTASAVLGDLVAVVRNRLANTSVGEGAHDAGLPVHDMG